MCKKYRQRKKRKVKSVFNIVGGWRVMSETGNPRSGDTNAFLSEMEIMLKLSWEGKHGKRSGTGFLYHINKFCRIEFLKSLKVCLGVWFCVFVCVCVNDKLLKEENTNERGWQH